MTEAEYERLCARIRATWPRLRNEHGWRLEDWATFKWHALRHPLSDVEALCVAAKNQGATLPRVWELIPDAEPEPEPGQERATPEYVKALLDTLFERQP